MLAATRAGDATSGSARRGRADIGIALGLAGATGALGLSRVGDSSFWGDEAFSAVLVHRSFGEVVSLLRSEAGMAPYYLALWFWSQFSRSEISLRLLSVLGAACTIAVTYLLVRAIVDRTAAVVTVIGLICNPTFLRYMTEVRAYSWMMCLGVTSTALLLRMRRSPSARSALSYGASLGLLLATNIFAAPLVLVHLWFARPMSSDERARRIALLGFGLAAAVVTPFLMPLLTSNQLSWIWPTTRYWVTNQSIDFLGNEAWALLLAAGNMCLLVLLATRRLEPRSGPPLALVLSSSIAVPVGLLLISLIKPSYVARYLSPVLPLVIIGAVAGPLLAVRMINLRGAHFGATTAFIIAFVIGFPGSPLRDMRHGEDLRAAAQYLQAEFQPGDAVVFDPASIDVNMSFYWTPPSGIVGLPPSAEPDIGVVRLSQQERLAQLATFCRVWRVERDDYSALEQWSEPGALLEVRHFDGITVTSVDSCDAAAHP